MAEKIEAEKIFTISKNALIVQVIAGIILIPAVGIGLLVLISALFRYFTHKLIVKQKSVTFKRGWIGSYTKEIPFSKINGVNVNQGIGGRWLDYGSLRIVTGNDIDTITFPYIESPEKVKKLLQLLVERNDPGHAHAQMTASTAAPQHTDVSKLELLEKLAALKQKGIITTEEFQKKKSQLLGLQETNLL